MQHNDDNIYESLTRETPEIRSQSLDTVEAALRRELHNQHIDLFKRGARVPDDRGRAVPEPAGVQTRNRRRREHKGAR